jgi:hypothetical protein
LLVTRKLIVVWPEILSVTYPKYSKTKHAPSCVHVSLLGVGVLVSVCVAVVVKVGVITGGVNVGVLVGVLVGVFVDRTGVSVGV